MGDGDAREEPEREEEETGWAMGRREAEEGTAGDGDAFAAAGAGGGACASHLIHMHTEYPFGALNFSIGGRASALCVPLKSQQQLGGGGRGREGFTEGATYIAVVALDPAAMSAREESISLHSSGGLFLSTTLRSKRNNRLQSLTFMLSCAMDEISQNSLQKMAVPASDTS